MLKTFLSKGLIHKGLNNEGAAKYALCKECTSEKIGMHVYFKFTNCEHTSCLGDIQISPIFLLKGFTSFEKNLHISGVCGHYSTM
ncbi:MAG: hypothetical protein AAF731_12690 [Bacteroidota bacterium]